MSLTKRVIDANIAVHSRLAAEYDRSEPHFRPENVAKVDQRLRTLIVATKAESLLDLGCGTGFIIGIAKRYLRHIVGVDVTQAMLDRVDRSGNARIDLVNQDTGTYDVGDSRFQLVTAYSFLHHLADLAPTFQTAHRSLVPGGQFYADLDPNWYFWNSIKALDANADYHPLLRREVEAVTAKDVEIETRFGVPREVFNQAEFGKDITGGFKEEALAHELHSAGFNRVDFHYQWFLGEGFLINSGTAPREELFRGAALVNDALQRALPVSRPLFKYLGFVATK
jgi:ubiquinone/menaquinone biosynthesis C-methylase UbiE